LTDGRTGAAGTVAPRVGLVCGHFDPARDGVADYTRQLARHLRRHGVDALVCTSSAYARGGEDAVVAVTDRWDLRGVLRAARELAQLRLDVIHVQYAPSAFGFCRAVGLLPRLGLAGTPVLATLHEYGVWSPSGAGGWLRSAAWSALERRGLADRETLLLTLHADRLLVTGTEHLPVLSERFPGCGVAATYVPIGPNIALAPLEHTRPAVRRSLGLALDAPLILFFGFLHPVKGLERLIEATADVRRGQPGLRLVLAGGGESHSVLGGAAAALRRQLQDVACRHGIEDDVTFTGYLPEQDVSGLLHAADVAVFPYDAGVTDKSGSLLAALAHGVPTIATSAPGAAGAAGMAGTDVASDGVLRVPPRDTAALAQALRLLLSDPGLAARLAAAGRAYAAGRTWEAVAATHARTYDEVLLEAGRGCRQRRKGRACHCGTA
jgi:glycosyltransferase involved in cell wall biosynthesis